MEKVKIPKKVAEAIENILKKDKTIALKYIALTDWSYLSKFFRDEYEVIINFANKNPLDYMKALVDGYVVEQTPEDKLAETYKKYEEVYLTSNEQVTKAYHYYVCQGIKLAVDTLGLQIKGINI